MRIGIVSVVITAFATLGGCAVGSEQALENTRVERRADTDAAGSYYIVTRQDTRKCMFPMCGGVYIRQVNAELTQCLDGTAQPDCYVAQIDLEQLGLDNASLDTLKSAADGGKAIIRGTLQTLKIQTMEAAVLLATEGWLGRAGADKPEGVGGFYRVLLNGVKCITWPCPSLKEETLNTTDTQNIHGLDLAAAGADQAALDDGQAALTTTGVLVAGSHTTITGPAGAGVSLAAAEFYTKVVGANGEPCGQSVCEVGAFCCNASCGICAPTGGACIELACMPCTHGVCEQGKKLNAGCDQCVKAVCALDAYCCNVAWDAICVAEATSECNACQNPSDPTPPPAPVCAHSECKPGASLEAECSDCAATVCAQDSFCCDNAWDALCVNQAQDVCGDVCAADPTDPTPPPATCAHNECKTGKALDATCSDCADLVCSEDSFCCSTAWDGFCVQEANALCNACQ